VDRRVAAERVVRSDGVTRRPPAATEPGPAYVASVGPTWLEYLRPLRFDHWIKNLVVPVGSLLALAAHRDYPGADDVEAILLAFVVSGLVSSVNYAVNEVLDAPFDAHHPTKRERPIPSGRVRVGPLLGLTAAVGLVAFGLCAWLLPPGVLAGGAALFLAGLAYNLPPLRLKDWPYLDAVTESLTNPIRLAIGWYAVAAGRMPTALLITVWAFGAFLMTGKRLAELRLLGAVAARYRPTFSAYSVRRLCLVQLAYALLGFGALASLVTAQRPAVLPALPLVAGLLGWAFKMTFEPESPLIDPEHLYRRPVFLVVALAVFALLVELAFG
jgi:decaprenyl-phosphate phosphoribosyltransferase